MGEITQYTYVTDNSQNICTDNYGNLVYVSYIIIVTKDGIEIRRVRNVLYPCSKCKYYHSYKFPATDIHYKTQLSRTYLPNINSGCGQPFVEILGICNDFEQRK